MKARSWAVVMIIFILIFTVGCGTQETDGDGTQPLETQTETGAGDESHDVVEEAMPQEDTTAEETLEGEALLASLAITTPENLSYEMVTTFNMEEELMITVTKVYMSEGNLRYETASDGMSTVMVYDESNEMIYSWDTDSQEGFMLPADDQTMAGMVEMDMTADYSGDDLNKDGDVNALDYLGYGDILTEAKLTEWEGHEAVYYDLVVDDGFGNESRMVMWVSTQFGIPLKSIYYDPSGDVTLEIEVNDLSDAPIDPVVFMPPEDINFVDMSEMMN